MDLKFFYKERTRFVSYFYENASKPFLDIKKSIEDEEEPYLPKNFYQEGEPEYLEDWIDAEEAFHTVGYTCISMLSSALHVYLKHWIKRLKKITPNEKEFKKGWFNGYKKILEEEFNIYLEKSEVDLEVIENIALARNRIQHPETLTTNYVTYSKKDVNKFADLSFVSTKDPVEESVKDAGLHKFFPPSIRPESEDVDKAIYNSEKLVSFLENEFTKLNDV